MQQRASFSEQIKRKFNARVQYDKDNSFHPRLAAKLVKLSDLREGWKVLDLACGTGYATFLAAAAVGPAGSVVGVDFSSVMLGQAREKLQQNGNSNIIFIEEDIEKLAFPEETFDAILCSSAFPYIVDKAASLHRFRSWLKKPYGVLAYNGVKSPYTALFPLMCTLLKDKGLNIQLPFSDVPDGKAHASLLKSVGFSLVTVTESSAAMLDEPVSVQKFAEWGWKMIFENCQMYFPISTLFSKSVQDAFQGDFLARASDLGAELANENGEVVETFKNIWLVARL